MFSGVSISNTTGSDHPPYIETLHITFQPRSTMRSMTVQSRDTPGKANIQHLVQDDGMEVGRLAKAIQDATGESVTLAYVDQGCS
jgi:hypothetical protein